MATTKKPSKKSTRKGRRKPSEAQIAARKEQTEALRAGMVEKIEALTDSDQWKRYLTSMASFHSYSFRNIMLILSQNENATQVAGFKAWREKHGRQVRKGEKALKIFGYATRKVTVVDKKTGEETEERVAYFPLRSVFDVSQTEPIEGQEAEIVHDLVGADHGDIYGRTADFLIARGWTVEREGIPGTVEGFTQLDGSMRVVIDEALSDAHAASVILHEAAHVLLHTDGNGEKDHDAVQHRGIGEIEAESVAYVVAGLLGLDTSDQSIGYIAGWGHGDIEMVQDTAQRVLTAVHALADELCPAEDSDADEDAADVA